MAKPKLSSLCLQVSWVRPNDGVWCMEPHNHEGRHSSGMECWSGAGDQDAHNDTFLVEMFLGHLLSKYEDDITPVRTIQVRTGRDVRERRPMFEDSPDGYKESDKDFVLNNLELAVKLLEAFK
jgi:hypothetical protein